jgi:non-ribosomal peptide synthetase-like protein
LTILPLATLGIGAFFCLLVLSLKWILLGRVRAGAHPLWSCWCSRWDFLYVAWAVYASRLLATLEGTLLLSWYLRAMGMRLGRRVVLGSGFAQVVDPDMLRFEDGATVSCQFQAHTFEDRVLKIDQVHIRSHATVGSTAVLLYGSDIGARAQVAPHSVVMKRESLVPGESYAGCPTCPVSRRGLEVSDFLDMRERVEQVSR